ncbi:hypothetical protein DPMN_150523 [Dreissena polymorpha]|uniref:Uncharacterized protein n=1 Tax=Dreissena polymorpha TaxID=45954 RepID=A0A9D4FER0_DREPO|nr:hypothetical protein DPMN_150523 [Dreissena polymorpha]
MISDEDGVDEQRVILNDVNEVDVTYGGGYGGGRYVEEKLLMIHVVIMKMGKKE